MCSSSFQSFRHITLQIIFLKKKRRKKIQSLLISINKRKVNVSITSFDSDGGLQNYHFQSRTVMSSLKGNLTPLINNHREFCSAGSAPDVTCAGGSRVFYKEWQGCGALSLETIKLSPLYFCGRTTEGFLSSPVALAMMRFEVSQPLCRVCNQNLHLRLLLSCGKYVHVEVLQAHVVHVLLS